MRNKRLYKLLNILIAAVWIINGLYCKILNLVPRHEAIVARILDPDYAPILTKAIGFSELLMAAWILSGFKSREIAILQMGIVLMMNILELILVPDLLLWGKLNFIFALLFIGGVYYTNFVLKEHLNK